LRAESIAAGGLPKLEASAETLAKQGIEPENFNAPVVPTIYQFGGQRLSLFGTIAQFSTVNDQTLDDLKVELFYPTDEETEVFFDNLPVM